MTNEQKQQVEECGSVGFDYRQVAVLTGLDLQTVKEQFTNERGEVYEAWLRGRLRSELSIRKSILSSAQEKSPSAGIMADKMMEIFHKTDNEHRDLME